MSTLVENQTVAKLNPAKLAKALEIYTIKKIVNKEFSKKKYRNYIGKEIISLTIESTSYVLKASNINSTDLKISYIQQSLSTLKTMSTQLDIANSMYETPIQNLEYWAEMIVDLEDSLKLWLDNMMK